jgi:4-hydroxy-4-methyl-2-oxoglutarate aldolase
MSHLRTIHQLAEFDTALLANTIGYLDPSPIHEYYMAGSIVSMLPELGPTVGVAVTCEVDTSSPFNPADQTLWWQILEQIENTPEPVVLVMKAVGSRPDHECIFGDGMAKLLYSVGCIGAVTDGGVRDLEGLATVPFAAYARLRTVHHTAVRFAAANRPVEVGGITVSSGDMIHANAGGVIKIPPACLEILPAKAADYLAYEAKAHGVWRNPTMSLKDKRQAVKALQAEYGFAAAIGR